jgi:pimeloyl-ACP methyl ester carboxylesterase
MTICKEFVGYDSQIIESYYSDIESKKTPVVISMGNWEPAFRSFDLIKSITERKSIVLSYRGRGESTAPIVGYNWNDHSNDLEKVIEHYNIDKAVFVAFSKGVSYTLGYISEKISVVSGLVLIDYPAIHSIVEKGYADFWYNLEYKDFKISDYVRKGAFEGIENESTEMDFYSTIKVLKCPILLCRGIDPTNPIKSNLSESDIEMYMKSNKSVKIENFEKSGHMIFDDEPKKLFSVINSFIKTID